MNLSPPALTPEAISWGGKTRWPHTTACTTVLWAGEGQFFHDVQSQLICAHGIVSAAVPLGLPPRSRAAFPVPPIISSKTSFYLNYSIPATTPQVICFIFCLPPWLWTCKNLLKNFIMSSANIKFTLYNYFHCYIRYSAFLLHFILVELCKLPWIFSIPYCLISWHYHAIW